MFGITETFQNKSKLISRRMFILSVLKLAVFISLVSRLFYLQISENLKYKSLLESKAYSGSPQRDLFYKIILGDKSDNIKPVFNKCGKKTVEKCFDDNDYFINKLDTENKQDIYELNKKLIDFYEIPIPLVKLFYSSILSSL